MKQLLIYIAPTGAFNIEIGALVKIQIDNSLDLGWKVEDLILVTNFPYEYRNVIALILDVEYYAPRPRSLNTTVVSMLFDMGLIGDHIYWVHDFDAYQLNTFTEADLDLDGFDLGLTDYGWKTRWCMGSFFFKKSAEDIFKTIKDIVYTDVEDETAITNLTNTNDTLNNPYFPRIKRLNITFNLGMRNVEENWGRATQPVKVLHFKPSYPLKIKTNLEERPRRRVLDIFMYGESGLGFPLMTDRLIKIFQDHNIK